jgi:ribosomal protein L21
MFAVIKTGGKQYRVAAEDEITVMTLKGEPGDVVAFEEVLALFDGETSHIGAPHVAGATVVGAIVSQELASQARPQARFDGGADHRVPDGRRQADRQGAVRSGAGGARRAKLKADSPFARFVVWKRKRVARR